MEIEIDISEVDEKVVDLIVVAVCMTMTETKHIDPTAAECIVAFDRLIGLVLAGEEKILH